ncbi:hypothetical protein BCU45_019725 [Vibrio lentus]|uniref:hypothetical protein n=1 Tax=Vibrio lentus TaxID=136468 RepID=UPI000C83E09B|nr:hypothetical protein [Vibrio lentus]PMI43867.1 hypothetical protein BCU45_01275 [Vibrio lentus]PMJ52771.1 hypothetical protein BCU20_04975 [Vibrio lentus]PMN00395.1 hypothetical protein BCT42_22980 [Vibrio lentus]
MVYKLTIPTLVLTTMLTACGGGSSGGKTASASKGVIDASSASSVVTLGSNYSLHLSVKSITPGTDKNVNIDITQYGNTQKASGSFAQVHGIPDRNYKTQSDADITFSVTATNAAGKTFDVENFSIYYENFNSTSTLEKLAIAEVENNINNVVRWKQADTVTINKQFIIDATGVKFNIDQMRPMNLYVRVGNTLSNGVQFVPSFAQSNSETFARVSTNDCSVISNTTGDLLVKGIKQRTCVEAHGYKIPLLIEDKAVNNSEAKVAHVKNIMQYYLDSFPAEVTKAIYDSKAAMAFFYDEDWSDRDGGDFLDENYRFQDLFATETTISTSSATKPYLPSSDPRDAAFEEIIHFVHDYGVMNLAVQSSSSKWAAMQKELDELNEKAILAGSYFPNGKDSTIVEADLDAESYDQEYLAYSLYAYYDLNFKGYNAQELSSATFAELQANDPEMVKFMEQYFPTRAALKAKFPGYPNN